MGYLWIVAGIFAGWILVEFVSAFTKCPMPTIFNFAASFIGGLSAYTVFFN